MPKGDRGGEVIGLNPNIRVYRYTKGQFFDAHCKFDLSLTGTWGSPLPVTRIVGTCLPAPPAPTQPPISVRGPGPAAQSHRPRSCPRPYQPVCNLRSQTMHCAGCGVARGLAYPHLASPSRTHESTRQDDHLLTNNVLQTTTRTM